MRGRGGYLGLGKNYLRQVAFWVLAGVVALGGAIQKGYGQSGGPPGAIIQALAIDPFTPSTLYAGTYGGVLKSTNGGASWTAVNSGLTTTTVNARAIDPSTPAALYA